MRPYDMMRFIKTTDADQPVFGHIKPQYVAVPQIGPRKGHRPALQQRLIAVT